MAKAILAIDQGTTGTTVMVLDAAAVSAAAPTAKCANTIRVPDGSSTTPQQIYRSVVRLAREAIAKRQDRRRMTSPASASPTSVRLSSSGSARAAVRSIARSYGNAAAAQKFANACAIVPPKSRAAPACWSILISPAPSSNGCSISDRSLRRRAAQASYVSAPSKPGSFSNCRAARFSLPITPTPRAP